MLVVGIVNKMNFTNIIRVTIYLNWIALCLSIISLYIAFYNSKGGGLGEGIWFIFMAIPVHFFNIQPVFYYFKTKENLSKIIMNIFYICSAFNLIAYLFTFICLAGALNAALSNYSEHNQIDLGFKTFIFLNVFYTLPIKSKFIDICNIRIINPIIHLFR